MYKLFAKGAPFVMSLVDALLFFLLVLQMFSTCLTFDNCRDYNFYCNSLTRRQHGSNNSSSSSTR